MKYEYTKTPLSYQISEYDCGQTTFLNALRYLFKRSEILPNVIKNIMSYTLDISNNCKNIETAETSIYAMEFLANWLNEISKYSSMKMQINLLSLEDFSIKNKDLIKSLNDGGVVILRVWQACEHYVLCTKVDNEFAYLFDPYYLNINYYDKDSECEIIKDRPFEFNRKVKLSRMNGKNKEDFSLVDGKNAQILLINKKEE